MNFREYIIRDPKIRNGVSVIKGTKITMKTVLEHLYLGDSFENILKTYPEISEEALTAVIAYAAGSAGVDIPDDSPSTIRPQDIPMAADFMKEHGQKTLFSDQEVANFLSSLKFRKEEK